METQHNLVVVALALLVLFLLPALEQRVKVLLGVKVQTAPAMVLVVVAALLRLVQTEQRALAVEVALELPLVFLDRL